MKRVFSVICVMILLAFAVLPLATNAAEMTDSDGINYEISTGGKYSLIFSNGVGDRSYHLNTTSAAEKNDKIKSVSDDGEVAQDGINTNAATVWIICISAVVTAAIIAVTVILAKRNKANK